MGKVTDDELKKYIRNLLLVRRIKLPEDYLYREGSHAKEMCEKAEEEIKVFRDKHLNNLEYDN